MKKTLDWTLRLVPAIILLQTLFFKYTGAEESIYIFKQLGIEPWGRYLVATIELCCAVLLIIPRTAGVGAVLTLVIMLGAIGGHLTKLGIEVAGDGGFLFTLALIVTVFSAMVAWKRKGQLKVMMILVKTKL